MEKPYLKKYKEVAGFSVWIVDGNYIRTNIEEEFVNYAEHSRFKFIPKKEFWIDKEYGGGNEADFYIHTMLIINYLVSKGHFYSSALDKADELEEKERRKSKFFMKKIKKDENYGDKIEGVHIKLLKEYSKKINVWVVDGELVRDLFFINFTEGGHDKVYSFIPQGEIWLDNDLSKNEMKFVFLHEIHERNLMSRGWCYDTDTAKNLKTGKIKKSAHKSSSQIEYYCRAHPKETERAIKKELEEIKS